MGAGEDEDVMDSEPPHKKRDWQSTLMFIISIAGAYGGIATTWAVQGERVTVLGVHREDHEKRLRAIESNDELKRLVSELRAEQLVQTAKMEELEKRIVELSEQLRRRR